MNVYILEIRAKLKENQEIPRYLGKWDGTSPLYYNLESGVLCKDASKSIVFFDKRRAMAFSKMIYKRNFCRFVVESVNILTVKMRLALPLDVRVSELAAR